MSIIRGTSTINIKPTSVSATSLAPSSVSTIRYSAYTDPNNTNRYGTFKYAAKTYGVTTEYSVGQLMPSISTEQI